MSKFLVLYNYNKYYNRIIKKLNTYNEYKALITPSGSTPASLRGLEIESTNFNWEDGVFAKHVINIPRGSSSFFNFHEPDYLVLERSYKDGDIPVTEVSRWFVLETTKLRGNQLELSLRRDLLADYFNEVLNAPVFIEKGNPGINDPAIFNRESMTFNQIKKSEILLNGTKRSGKGNGWIVGYIAKEETPTDIGPCEGQAEVPTDVDDFDDLPAALKALINDGTGEGYDTSDAYMLFPVAVTIGGTTTEYRDYRTHLSSGNTFRNYPDPTGSNLGYARMNFNSSSDSYRSESIIKNAYLSGKTSLNLTGKLSAWFSTNYPNAFNKWVYGNYSQYNNLIYTRNGKYYRLKITRVSGANDFNNHKVIYTISNINSQSSDLASGFLNFMELYLLNPPDIVRNTSVNTSSNGVVFNQPTQTYSFVSEEIDYDLVRVTLTKERNKNLDAPYDVFCIPMRDVSVYSSGGSLLLTQPAYIAEAIARAISIKGGSKIYDIQILPYCPIEECLTSDGDISLAGLTSGKDYSYITKTNGGSSVGIVLYAKHCRGTFDLSLTSSSEISRFVNEEISDPLDKKVFSETHVCRFVSPNFASSFEINVQKNKGIAGDSSLNVDYFYKPYSPYIHIAPYFKGLYGNDFNDPKGLICSGEFSIATAQSQWENYEIQNKNYELIFNRQIQNLDVNNSIAYDVQKITAGIGQGTSLLTGLAGGAVAGSMIGGPIGTAVGAAAGAIGGAVLSGVGAKYDLEYLKKSQTEARSYAQDMYGYNLGNIKALPYSLTRVSSFTENNKIFPFIEFYECTDEERQALKDKIKYNGMTIMRIGKIVDFVRPYYKYVQGQLIRLEGINEDSHVIAEIAREIKEGAYYYGTDTI